MKSPFATPVQSVVPAAKVTVLRSKPDTQISPERKARARKVAKRIGGCWFDRPAWQDALMLGTDFADALAQARQGLAGLQKAIERDLSSLDDDRLVGLLDMATSGEDPTVRTWRSVIDKHAAQLPFWVRTVIGTKDARADYDLWGKASGLTATEAFLLSLGLNPVEAFLRGFEAEGPGAQDPISNALRMRHRVFVRSVNPNMGQDVIPAAQVLHTVTIQGFETTAGFRVMLDRIAWRDARSDIWRDSRHATSTNDVEIEVVDETAAQTLPTESAAALDRREFNTMCRLVTILAMEHYQYDPTKKKSDVPARISSKARLHGLDISEPTVRKLLRRGAEQMTGEAPPVDGANGNRQTTKRK